MIDVKTGGWKSFPRSPSARKAGRCSPKFKPRCTTALPARRSCHVCSDLAGALSPAVKSEKSLTNWTAAGRASSGSSA